MSFSQDTIDQYIAKTLTAEQQSDVGAGVAERSEHEIRDEHLRALLQEALDQDDKKAAIRFAYELLEDDGEDEKIDQLYEFLLTRVGVPEREPLFAMSLQPVVQWCSGVCVAIPLILIASHFLSPVQGPASEQTDVLMCLGTALIFGLPLWDVVYAGAYNRRNRHRLIQPSIVR